MYLMDRFLGGQFTTYGTDVIRISGLEVPVLHMFLLYYI
jgi:hypothetical protein